jgi:hypothetical protein
MHAALAYPTAGVPGWWTFLPLVGTGPELGHIRSLSDSEACRLCGVRAPLTEEHAPSRAAGDAGLLFGGRIDDAATKTTGHVIWTDDVPAPDGATVQTLCAYCNKNSGRRYNPAYVALVKAAEPLARKYGRPTG